MLIVQGNSAAIPEHPQSLPAPLALLKHYLTGKPLPRAGEQLFVPGGAEQGSTRKGPPACKAHPRPPTPQPRYVHRNAAGEPHKAAKSERPAAHPVRRMRTSTLGGVVTCACAREGGNPRRVVRSPSGGCCPRSRPGRAVRRGEGMRGRSGAAARLQT